MLGTVPGIDLQLSGHSDAKGRNGYYKLARVQFLLMRADGHLHVDFYSKREPGGNCAPARLVLNQVDARALHTALGEALDLAF